MKKLARFAVAVFTLMSLAAPLAASADVPGVHPRYIHALSDLRTVAALLNRPEEYNVERDQERALTEVNQAIYEVGQAAADDQKNLGTFFPPDVNLSHADRLGRARRLLEGIQTDLSQPETNGVAAPWQQAALRDTAKALRYVNQAIRDNRYDQWYRNQ